MGKRANKRRSAGGVKDGATSAKMRKEDDSGKSVPEVTSIYFKTAKASKGKESVRRLNKVVIASKTKSNVDKNEKMSKKVKNLGNDSGVSTDDCASNVTGDKVVFLDKGGLKEKVNKKEKNSVNDSGISSDDGAGNVTGDKASLSDRVDVSGRLDFKFYDRSCEDLAKMLLGQIVVTTFEGHRLAGKIVETEAYLGAIDKAAHSYKGKTDRNSAMFMQPGTAYVYDIYGMYCCLNISAQGDGKAVLIRSLQPLENLPIMDKLRTKGKEGGKLLKKDGKDLCNGPSKLCQALAIKKNTINKQDMCTSDLIWLEPGEVIDSSKIVVCKRINIQYAEEWIDKPLRYYLHGNNFVSVRDKVAEQKMKLQ